MHGLEKRGIDNTCQSYVLFSLQHRKHGWMNMWRPHYVTYLQLNTMCVHRVGKITIPIYVWIYLWSKRSLAPAYRGHLLSICLQVKFCFLMITLFSATALQLISQVAAVTSWLEHSLKTELLPYIYIYPINPTNFWWKVIKCSFTVKTKWNKWVGLLLNINILYIVHRLGCWYLLCTTATHKKQRWSLRRACSGTRGQIHVIMAHQDFYIWTLGTAEGQAHYWCIVFVALLLDFLLKRSLKSVDTKADKESKSLS